MPVENVDATVSALRGLAVDVGDLDAFMVLSQMLEDTLKREEPVATGYLRSTTTVVAAAPNVAEVAITADYARAVRAHNDFVARADVQLDHDTTAVVSDALDELIRRYDLE